MIKVTKVGVEMVRH